MNKPIWIVGIQKSGTSLLVHLLEESGVGISHSGRIEDTKFWGDMPSFSPTAWPSGMIYQNSSGENGHEVNEEWATPQITDHLRKKIAIDLEKYSDHQLVFGKNPYNSVRIPWIRRIFPDSIIVALVRRPVANVYSLWKRYQPGPHTAPPEDGWWGVKPKGWRNLVRDDKIEQIAYQWNAVNARILQNRGLIDLVIPYHELCAEPERAVASILELSNGSIVKKPRITPKLDCFDDEYTKGSCLRSKNKFQTGTLQPETGSVELAPFTITQIDLVESICKGTKATLGMN